VKLLFRIYGDTIYAFAGKDKDKLMNVMKTVTRVIYNITITEFIVMSVIIKVLSMIWF